MSKNSARTMDDCRDQGTGRFLTGNIGGGRPKGSRNKLGEQFITDLHAEWQTSGVGALKRMASEEPSAFVKAVAGILPREVDATLSVDSDLFAETRDFAAAYQLALQTIGSEHSQPLDLMANPSARLEHLDTPEHPQAGLRDSPMSPRRLGRPKTPEKK